MASVNKGVLTDLYHTKMMSIPDIASELNVSRSTARNMLIRNGVELRSRSDGIRCVSYKLGLHSKGKKRIFSQEWKENIKKAMNIYANKHAKGISIKPNGYVEITRGNNKGKKQHIVIMEERIGRKLFYDEVVHHIDGDRSNNDINNLALMTRKGHCKHHALENHDKRIRNKYGQFK